jgi:hypothetical protein
VAEPHPDPRLDEAGGLRGAGGGGLEPEPVGGAHEQRQVPDRLGRRDQHELARGVGQRLDPPQEAALDAMREGHRARDPEPAAELGRRQPVGQLEQRERVPPRLGDDPVAKLLVEPPADRRLQQGARVVVRQPLDHELRQAVQRQVVARLADREDQAHGLREQAPRDEGERLRRRLVLPLRVVDDADQRALLGHLGQEAQHGEPDEEAVGGRPRDAAERGAERHALRVGQPLHPVEHRRAELMDARERELHLGFHARRPRDATPRRALHEVVEQRGLADARLAPQDQHAAVAGAHVVHQPRQRLALPASSTQIGPRGAVDHGRRGA